MMSYLGILAIILVVIILYQISRATDFLGELRNSQASDEDRNNNLQASLFLFTMIGGFIAIVWSAFHYKDFYIFLMEPMSAHSEAVNGMYFWTLVAIVPVFFLTNGLLFWFAYRYKKNSNKLAFFYPENNRLELIWMAIPAVVMVFLVFEGMRNWFNIMSNEPENAIVIEANAQQFKWDFRYSGEDNKLGFKTVRKMGEDNPWGIDWTDPKVKDDFMATDLYLPVNEPVMIKIVGLDVLHSLYLPHFNVKMDAVPGIPTQFYFTPIKTTAEMREAMDDPEFNFELACAELCGKSHFNMRRQVFVVSREEYDAWTKEQSKLYDDYKSSLQSQSADNLDNQETEEIGLIAQ